jgi:hypothetical protein
MERAPKGTNELLWVSLSDALKHIQAVEVCDAVVAEVLLKSRIGNGLVPVKWGDTKGRAGPPDVEYLARTQFVLSVPGFALNKSGCLRPLLVLRSAIYGWSAESAFVTTLTGELL